METRDHVLSFRVTASAKAELQRRADLARRKLADYMALLIEDHLAEPADTPPSTAYQRAVKASKGEAAKRKR